MNKREQIEDFQKKIKNIERDISNCKHVWKDSKYDPETISVADDRAGYEEHGVDRWPKLSFHNEQKPRWSRECKECGNIEYTYTQEVIKVDKQPKFN